MHTLSMHVVAIIQFLILDVQPLNEKKIRWLLKSDVFSDGYSVLNLVGSENGVQGVGGSNPLAPTKT